MVSLAGEEKLARKEFFHPVRVYIEDTDAGGIVYYVNYLKFFERARTEFLRSLGCTKVAVLEKSLLLVVKRAEVEYQAPAKLEDELLITAKVAKLARSYVVFAQEVHRGQQILCTSKIQVACVKSSSGVMVPVAIPKNIHRALQEWVNYE
ncbi:MAG: 4-hydroxybenzoyl-CoA thioesterase [Cellvibrionaceae bacterium]|jgi:4-hydroxybenzoyl-CoA thioesterase